MPIHIVIAGIIAILANLAAVFMRGQHITFQRQRRMTFTICSTWGLRQCAIEALGRVSYKALRDRNKQTLTMKSQNVLNGTAITLALLGGAIATSVLIPAFAQNLPDGNGKELVQTICTSCHDLS